MKRILVGALVLGSMFLAAPVQAGTASCSVSPNPDPMGTQFTISLTGGPANTDLRVRVESQGHYLQFLGMHTDSGGSGTSFGYPRTTGPTTATIQLLSNANVAKCSFVVT